MKGLKGRKYAFGKAMLHTENYARLLSEYERE